MLAVLSRWLARDLHGGGGFQNAAWDSFVPGPEVWREVFRVLKPGGYLVAFGAPRCYDLLALSIRLAGFTIRDSLHWVYANGNGGTKSHNLSLAIDKAAGHERRVSGHGRTNIELDIGPRRPRKPSSGSAGAHRWRRPTSQSSSRRSRSRGPMRATCSSTASAASTSTAARPRTGPGRTSSTATAPTATVPAWTAVRRRPRRAARQRNFGQVPGLPTRRALSLLRQAIAGRAQRRPGRQLRGALVGPPRGGRPGRLRREGRCAPEEPPSDDQAGRAHGLALPAGNAARRRRPRPLRGLGLDRLRRRRGGVPLRRHRARP